jgi:hypothetical protein
MVLGTGSLEWSTLLANSDQMPGKVGQKNTWTDETARLAFVNEQHELNHEE